MIRLCIRCKRYVLGILYHKKKSITDCALNENALFHFKLSEKGRLY
jgi:hypothetical protein